MKELNFDSELCRVCQEHMVCDAQSEEVVEEMAELTFFNEFCSPCFDRCPCCGCEVSDETREDKDYELRAINYMREDD
jgi:hypothetical protein